MGIEDYVKTSLGFDFVRKLGFGSGGGCISQGHCYDTNKGKIFVKENGETGAKRMFRGEYESLAAIHKTGTVRVPKPLGVLDAPKGGGALLVMEFLEMGSVGSKMADLGTNLAKLHLHNRKYEGTDAYVSKFGFDVETCCGFLPQGNKWESDWVKFYTNKLQEQMDMIETNYGDAEAERLWAKMKPNIPKLFEGIDEIKPSLVHGDLWSGNAAATKDEPVVFDAASFYGHSEYDLGIAGMFGGFSKDFYNAYHKLIPKEKGFEERHQIYKLFHCLNHWNHFGGGYKSQSISIMRKFT